MKWTYVVFGEGTNLNGLQMCSRSIVVFLVCLVLIRLSGRRSFGLKAPFDNIIAILLGAMLSRAIVGASPFLPVVVGSLVLVIMHRLLGWFIVSNKRFEAMIEGDKIVLYKDKKFLTRNMERALVSKEDIMQGVRGKMQTEDMHKVETIYMERNGKISLVVGE